MIRRKPDRHFVPTFNPDVERGPEPGDSSV